MSLSWFLYQPPAGLPAILGTEDLSAFDCSMPAGTPVGPTHRRPLPHQPPPAVGPLSEGNGALPDGQSPHRRALPAAPTARTATGFLPAPGQVTMPSARTRPALPSGRLPDLTDKFLTAQVTNVDSDLHPTIARQFSQKFYCDGTFGW